MNTCLYWQLRLPSGQCDSNRGSLFQARTVSWGPWSGRPGSAEGEKRPLVAPPVLLFATISQLGVNLPPRWPSQLDNHACPGHFASSRKQQLASIMARLGQRTWCRCDFQVAVNLTKLSGWLIGNGPRLS